MYQKAALCRMIANKMELKSLIFENPSDVDNIGTKINHFYLTWTGNPNYRFPIGLYPWIYKLLRT